jgi:hypothetical protein
VSLCRSARLREGRRADLARYFGAQLAPSAALQAADTTLLQALEVCPICSKAELQPTQTTVFMAPGQA